MQMTKKKKFKRNKSIKRYAIFVKKNGKIFGFAEASFSMYWSRNKACLFDKPPKHYFKPQEGHFLVCTTKPYDDIQFDGYSGSKGNYTFKIKQGDGFVLIPDKKG